jgi:hypothetical protein
MVVDVAFLLYAITLPAGQVYYYYYKSPIHHPALDAGLPFPQPGRAALFSELGALEGMHACFWFVYLVSCGHGTKAAGRLLQPCPCMRIEKQLHFAQPYIYIVVYTTRHDTTKLVDSCSINHKMN